MPPGGSFLFGLAWGSVYLKIDRSALSEAGTDVLPGCVVRAGAGYDNVDLAAATAHNVCVMNTPGQNSNAVAELALGMMVYAVRNFYNGTSGTELMGKKLGIHAYGNVGRNVARVAKGFGMEVYAYDAFCPKEVIEKDGVKALDSAEELYKTCQVVSLHIPATAETKNSINYALLKDMPKGAMLVNTARKEVINEAELIKLMEDRADFKYMTDIMPAANAEFAEKFAGRYFSTPKKMGAQTAEANINAGIAYPRAVGQLWLCWALLCPSGLCTAPCVFFSRTQAQGTPQIWTCNPRGEQ